ncbi:DNA-directed RNA polymerase subunit alpha C-terminal domain-containing protein [Bacteroides sp. 14(A)]|uniref:DNA-directed RNA polymerase subunit alpha C-terminal domain-containing protein n=1 Tax=Bacteroides sp. 14(A) TaxID=1163670 RepID=UPI0004AC92FE|nr:DNA-directed RNA polymerase subunit alpha C-terminal domain-containing protein [Bacteroides sp. 14(A)]
MAKIDINQSVETLDFGRKYDTRIQRICREFRITTIRDLCQWPGRDLMKVHDMGEKSIEEIEAVLGKYDLRLGMLGEELDEYAGTGNSKQEEAEAALWEQRRYEIAKEMFVKHRMLAVAAVNEADELIRALRR